MIGQLKLQIVHKVIICIISRCHTADPSHIRHSRMLIVSIAHRSQILPYIWPSFNTHARARSDGRRLLDDPPSAHFRKLTETHRATTRPLPPARSPAATLPSAPLRGGTRCPPADRFQLRCYTPPQDGGPQMAPLAFTSRRSRQRVHNGAFVGTEVIFCHRF